MSSVLVVASDHVGSSMAGPGIRYLWFARELARRGYGVTLVVPFETDLQADEFALVVDNPWDAGRMTELGRRHDAVVTQRLPVPAMLALARTRTRVVYDLYSPPPLEYAAFARDQAWRPVDFALQQLTLRVALETGSAFLCASERQRDLWLGALAAVGRIDPDRYRADPTFRSLVDVVPFGVEPTPPVSNGPVLKGVVPGIEPTDKVALWGGGIWNWLDPLTVIRAVARLNRPDVKLYFLGTARPNPGIPTMAMFGRAVALAEELGLAGRSVFFNSGWVPYEDRGGYLLEADVGVSAHFDELETRFAFRTRLLDCMWAGLPIVTTVGDSLADLVRDRKLGAAVGYGDVDGYADALGVTLDLDRKALAPQFADLSRELAWPLAVEPLLAVLESGGGAGHVGATGRAARNAGYLALRGRSAVRSRGFLGLIGRISSGVARPVHGDPPAHPPPDSKQAAVEERPPGEPLP